MTWKPDSHRDPYVWTAVLGGHLAIGVALWIACMWGHPWAAVLAASLLYAAWESWSAAKWGLLLWDSLLDWVGVTFGAFTACGLWLQSWPLAAVCGASALIIGIAGYRTRTDPPSDNGA